LIVLQATESGFGNWGSISFFCIRKSHLTSYNLDIQFRIQNRGVSLLNFAVLILLNTQKHYWRCVCCLIYRNRQRMDIINFFPDCFQLFFSIIPFRRHLLFKYWQELKVRILKKSNSASMFCFWIGVIFYIKYIIFEIVSTK
jgi:hypothetical protein